MADAIFTSPEQSNPTASFTGSSSESPTFSVDVSVTSHDKLKGRELENQHPISAITGLDEAINGKQDVIEDLDAIRSGASAGATALQPPALSGYATQEWVGKQGFLTSTALSGYATEQWVVNQGYLTSSALNGYATKQYVDDIVGDIETILYNINSGS